MIFLSHLKPKERIYLFEMIRQGLPDYPWDYETFQSVKIKFVGQAFENIKSKLTSRQVSVIQNIVNKVIGK